MVLTAVEMGAQRRFSTITIKENNVLDGDMERLLIDGVTDILTRLPSLPPAVLVYTSCTIFSAATLPCATANYEADSRASILPTAT